MTEDVLDIVGKLLMVRIRDKAINDWNMILDGSMKGALTETVRKEIAGANSTTEALECIVPRVVDSVLHHLLWTLEQEEWINVSVEVDGETTSSIREISDGLAGELYTEDGWIARFSQYPPTI